MFRHIHIASVLAIILWVVQPSAQAVTLSLSSSPADLSSLMVNDVVMVDVILGGLGVSESLDFLGATVSFDPGVFGSPTGISPGAIIPDPTGFIGSASPGLADGLFDAFFTASGTDEITTNGVFFSFDLQVVGSGSGSIDFDFAEAFFDIDTGDVAPVEVDDPLDFTAPRPDDGIIPEPLTATLGLIGVTALGLSLRRRRFA